MIQVTPHMRILVSRQAVDFRKGMDGIIRLCREYLKEDPFSGTYFIFRNRRETSIKILIYDGQGFWLCQKRLSEGQFQWWPTNEEQAGSSIKAHELQILLNAGNGSRCNVPPEWKSLRT
jgi:transposase